MRIYLLGLIIFMPSLLLAQGGVRLGYGYNFGNAAEINRILYIYNSTGNFTKPINYLKMAKGLQFTYLIDFAENSGVEFRWQNRHRILSSNWNDGVDEFQRDLKFRQNYFGINFYTGGGGVYAGFGFDFGNWKMWTRRGTSTEIADLEYEDVAIISSLHGGGGFDWLFKTQIAFPIFIGFETKVIGARLTWQIQAQKMYLDYLDNYLIGRNIESYNELEGKFSNIGLDIYIKIGGFK